jgi:hypothetical protein
MARNGNLFALTSPTGQVGIFHQLGTTVRGRVCVQNCLVEKFGRNKVTIGKGLGLHLGYHLTLNTLNGVGYFMTPDGPYTVERITAADPRYNTSPVIKEYSDFFGKSSVVAVENFTYAAVRKQEKKDYTKHLAALKLLDDLLESLGYVKHNNVAPLRRAAKKKK